MSVLTKKGNGGHGLEAYDSETGKYVEVSVSFNGQEIENWQHLRDVLLEANPQWKQAYDSDSSVAEQFDNYIQDEIYAPLVEQSVNEMNENAKAQTIFSTPTETADNLDTFFTNKMVDDLLNNGILKSNTIAVNPYKPSYIVSTWAACFQKNRYKGNCRMNPISQQEYDSRRKNFPTLQLSSYAYFHETKDYINSADEIPLSRCCLSYNSNPNLADEVRRSFWDENSKIHSVLSHAGGVNCSYYGTCIYMLTGGHDWDDDASVIVHGIAKPKEMKILENPNHGILPPEIQEFIYRLSSNWTQIKGNIVNKLVSTGKCDNAQAGQIADSFYYQALEGNKREVKGVLGGRHNVDVGFCAMVLGYDALYGEDAHFDILNPNKVDIVR